MSILLGKTFAISKFKSYFLRPLQELVGFPEGHFYEFRLFTGEIIKLDHDGKFYIDGKRCSGAAFTGVDNC